MTSEEVARRSAKIAESAARAAWLSGEAVPAVKKTTTRIFPARH